jgi:hypothetical protein
MRATTKKKLSTAAETPTTEAPAARASPAAASTAAAAPAATAPAASAAAPAASIIPMPPSLATIPTVPQGWVARPNEDYRGIQPRKAELSTIENAIADLEKFTDYTQVLGATAPPLAHVILLLQVGAAWSAMRTSTGAWDVYSQAQEGLSWGAIRDVVSTLRPSFDLAVKINASLATRLPSLLAWLDVQKVIARKGASTRKANVSEKASGNPETHGKVGKARQRAAAKAALAAQSAASTNQTETPVAVAEPPQAAAPPPPAAPASKPTAGAASN